ncbi:MAG: hypothetical protein OJF59_000081 [Cytophagales bacterium]|jgi:hypothetical protein|nr:hypothetical protein [Bacteroidota bacterium]WHZ06329.1 MAG: hypothetical protein OJF59_000081 [Cytophagales bacterium]
MRYILIVALIIIVSTTFAQQIQNVKAVQQGTKVIVSYDLNDQSGKPYYVKLLMSKDGGATFGEELKYVSGDVKNSKAGIGKKIIWDAAQEISYYDGDAIFRVEAVMKSAPLPEPIELKCSKVELVNVKGSGSRVTIDFIATALFDESTELNKDRCFLFDPSGNQFMPSMEKFGDSPMDKPKQVIQGVPVKSQLIFDNINPEVTSIPMLKINLFTTSNSCYAGSDNEKLFQFRNIPISR